jgi:KDO2-lipid IV(A) lauroyltransferase
MKRKLRYIAKWIFHYVISPIVPHIPLPLLRHMGKILGNLNYLISAHLRQQIESNVKEVFPEKSGEEIREICRRNFINHATHSLEILYLPKVDDKFVKKYVRVNKFENVSKALENGNGIVIVLAHVGPYYLSGVTLQLLGVPMNDISQDITKLDMSGLDRKILEKRLRNYQSRISGKMFRRGGPLVGVIKAIKRNESITLFLDAFTTDRDPIVDFLGRKTRAPQGPIRIATQTGAPIIFYAPLREKSGVTTFTLSDPVELETKGDKEETLQRNAQKCMDLLDPIIRQYPDQWHLWRTFHERWITDDERE